MERETLLRELERLDADLDVEAILDTWRDEGAMTRRVGDPDVPDPGPEVGIGEYGRVAFEELGREERIILPDTNFLPVHFLEEGATRQKAVARIARKSPHGAWGTGWLVGRDLLMTNNHVISTKAQATTLQAEFNYQLALDGSAETPDVYQFDPDGFFYTNAALDFTLIKLKCKSLSITLPLKVQPTADGEYLVLDEEAWAADNGEAIINGGVATGINTGAITANPGISIVRRPPFLLCVPASARWGRLQLPSGPVPVANDQHVNIIQHPRGRRKEVALQQNRLDHIYTNHLRYTTDTEPGSSGSPVFNNGWDVIAIHHAGGEFTNGQWVNNQGVRIDRIVDDIQANHAAGSWVRGQLGV